jgi:hypothetical protein
MEDSSRRERHVDVVVNSCKENPMSRHPGSPQLKRSNGIVRRARFAVVAGIAAAFMLVGVSPSSADVFSPVSTLVTSHARLGSTDCFATFGPVQDPAPLAAGFRIIAGAEVNCQSRHAQVAVTVRQFVLSGAWYEVGRGAGAVYTNSAGFGNRILELNVGCQHAAFPGGYWETGVYVQIDGHGYGWIYSPSNSKPIFGNC